MSINTQARHSRLFLLASVVLLAHGGCSSPQPSPPSKPCGAAVDADGGTLECMSLDLFGLFTNPNPIGQQVPTGALAKADDIDIDRPGVGTPRRNDDTYPDDPVATEGGTDIRELFDFGAQHFAWNGSRLYRWTFNTTPDGTFIAYTPAGSVGSVPFTGTLRHATLGGDLYVTSNNGPLVVDGASASPKVPGAPRALDADPAYTGYIDLNASGWLGEGESVAYRIVIGYNDAEGKPVLGAPSGRLVVTHTGVGLGPAYGRPAFMLPSGLTTSNFVALYRTTKVGAGVDPGDIMFKCYEAPLTTANVSGPPYPNVLIVDIAPDALLGEPLYTNSAQGGERNNNMRPPLAQDVATFRNRVWMANTQRTQALRLRLIGLPASGNTVIINGRTYTASNLSNDVALRRFHVETAGTVSENIAVTARNLVAVVALDSGGTLNAYYASNDVDPPGIIDLEQRSLSGAAFTASAAVAGGVFVPNITSAVSSTSDTYANRLHYSKDGLGYAFPLSNTLPVGAQEHGISRIVALKETLLIFKARGGDGLWKVTGSGPFYVEQVNPNVQLVAPDSVVVANNTAFAWTEGGVIQVSESGAVDVISVPIEPVLKDMLLTRSSTAPYGRAFVKEANAETKVFFGFCPSDDATYIAESYVWNINTETWVRDTREWTSAYTSNGSITRAKTGDGGTLYRERNTGNEISDRAGTAYAVKWNTETGGDVGAMKQFTQAHVLFEQAQPASVSVSMYFDGDGGPSDDGAVLTGGEGLPYIRAEVPLDTQRTSRLGVEIRGVAPADTATNIVGMQALYRAYAPLTGR